MPTAMLAENRGSTQGLLTASILGSESGCSDGRLDTAPPDESAEVPTEPAGCALVPLPEVGVIVGLAGGTCAQFHQISSAEVLISLIRAPASSEEAYGVAA